MSNSILEYTTITILALILLAIIVESYLGQREKYKRRRKDEDM